MISYPGNLLMILTLVCLDNFKAAIDPGKPVLK